MTLRRICLAALAAAVPTAFSASAPAAASPPADRSASLSLTIVASPPRTITSRSVSIAFATANARVVRCRLDHGAVHSCSSPARFRNLARGVHVFKVTASAAGRSTRAVASWSVSGKKKPVPVPAPAPTSAPAPAPVPGPAAPTRGAAPVAPPSSYTIPSGATAVSTSAQLATALAQSGARDIVLADGSYDAVSAFANAEGDRLYAAHLGKAIFHAGISIGGNWGRGGGLIQGIAFDVSDPAKVISNAIVHVWGTGQNTRILDTTFDGHNAIGEAIDARVPEGFSAERIVARNLTSNGVLVDSYPAKVTFLVAPTLSDIDVANVARPVPTSSNGTAEACIWLGTQVTLTRAKLRSCAWTGLWTGFNGLGSTYSDVDVDATPIGVYIEHFTTGSRFSHLHVGSSVRTGVNCEWDDPAWGGRAASTDNVIADSLIESSQNGVFMDEGTTRTSVVNTTFRNQTSAAIVDYRGVSNSYSGNDYSGIAATGVAITHDHP